MQAYHVEMTIQQDGTLTLTNLPVQAGETVEVIVLVQPPRPPCPSHYPLRGTLLTYHDPTEPVAQADWEATR